MKTAEYEELYLGLRGETMDYSKLTEITAKSQKELDEIPKDFAGKIYIKFGSYYDRAVVRKKYRSSVVARGNSYVEARENSSVEAWDNSSVMAWGDSCVVARDNSSVVAWQNSSVEARENSSVEARQNSSVVAQGNSYVEARENSSVVARQNSSVVARNKSSVEARDNSSVVAWDNSFVEAQENSSVVAQRDSWVVAWDNSSVEARGDSHVEAWGNSYVVAWENGFVYGNGNAQIVNRSGRAKIKVTGNARIVYMPKNIEDYCNFYGIEHDKETGRFYKCVHKIGGKYFSDNDSSFEYKVGEKAIPDSFNDDVKEDCGHGIHVAHIGWALGYGGNWDDIAVIEVAAKLKNIVVPSESPEKVRCKEVEVIREVPLCECGVLGKIIAKRLGV